MVKIAKAGCFISRIAKLFSIDIFINVSLLRAANHYFSSQHYHWSKFLLMFLYCEAFYWKWIKTSRNRTSFRRLSDVKGHLRRYSLSFVLNRKYPSPNFKRIVLTIWDVRWMLKRRFKLTVSVCINLSEETRSRMFIVYVYAACSFLCMKFLFQLKE